MATLRVKAAHLPAISVLPHFAGVIAFLGAAIDVFTEAQNMARAANKRYPFFAE